MIRSALKKPRVRIQIGFTIAVVLFLVLLMKYADRQRQAIPLDFFAHQVIFAIDDQDADFLLGAMMPHEKELMDMDRGKVKALLDWYEAAVKGKSIEKDLALSYLDDSGSGLVAIRSGQTNGGAFALTLPVFKTDDGPRAFVATPLIMAGLHAKYLHEVPADAYGRYSLAMIRGSRQEREFFESIGLEGYVERNANPTFVSWDDLSKREETLATAYKEYLADQASSSAGPN